jgi:hypothetical protein
MGDEAISMALDAIEASGSPDTGHRIEHCTLPTPHDVERMARLGVTPVMQPIFLFAEGEAYRSKLGEERFSLGEPRAVDDRRGRFRRARLRCPRDHLGRANRRLPRSRGVRPPSHVGGQRPRRGAGDHRGGGDPRLHPERGPSGRARDDPGLHRAGKRADLAVLSEDPLHTAPEDLHRIEVTATVLGGEVAFGEL